MDYTVVMYPKVQDDTAVAYFLLKKFGENKFPGIKDAGVEFWSELPEDKNIEELEAEGYILLDLGGGEFDHHRLDQDNRQYACSHLVAAYLGIDDRPDLQKLLEWARRSDLEGKGTISKDPIDRAFGLAGLLTALNKTVRDKRQILDIIMPFLEAHWVEENRRQEVLPQEFEELVKNGKVKEFRATHREKVLKIIYIETNNPTLAGYLRSKAVGADLIIQRASTGHVNFVTRQRQFGPRMELKKLARLVKLAEAEKNDLVLDIESERELEQPGRTAGLPHWFYDARANTLQNGGLNPQDIPPTKLTFEEIQHLTKEGLNIAKQRLGVNPAQRRQQHSPRVRYL